MNCNLVNFFLGDQKKKELGRREKKKEAIGPVL